MSQNLRLNPKDVLRNAKERHVRVSQRFHGRNLERHSKQLVELAEQAEKDYARLASPWYLIRIASFLLIVLAITSGIGGLYFFNEYFSADFQELNINDKLSVVQLIGWVVFFVVGVLVWRIRGLEGNLKRALIRKRIEVLKGYLRVLSALNRDKEAVRVYDWYKPTDDSPKVTDDTKGIYNYLRHSGVLAEIIGDIGELYNDSYSDERVDEFIKSLDRVTEQTIRGIYHKQEELAQAMLLEQYGGIKEETVRSLLAPKPVPRLPEKTSGDSSK